MILRMLIDARIEWRRWPGIYDSASGLVFLGTPFRGTNDTLSQGEILQYAQEHFTNGPVYGDNLEIIRSVGEQLGDLLEIYFRIARQHEMPRMACFFEQIPSQVGRILGPGVGEVLSIHILAPFGIAILTWENQQDIASVILVSEESGCLDLGPKTDKYGLPRNHFQHPEVWEPERLEFRRRSGRYRPNG